jgi:hypothetical protein|tara:strand:+ start:623 stop:883 length:261 start_codon:yes stop_codon:yes gene_type:complete
MSVKLKDLIVNKKPKIKKPMYEGFFSKLKSLLGLDKDKQKALKKDKKIKKSLNKLNGAWSDLEKMIERDYGEKVNFKKFKISDFLN